MLPLLLLLSILDPMSPAMPEGAEPPYPCLCAFSDEDICAVESGTCVCVTDEGWHSFRVSTADEGGCDQITSLDVEQD